MQAWSEHGSSEEHGFSQASGDGSRETVDSPPQMLGVGKVVSVSSTSLAPGALEAEPSVSKGVRFEEISFTPHAMHVDV